ncbi:YhcN/YlaJ family sporulation lipoprotein [Metabacillus fastidiosus]|nr:YhcN/YlaJ family sporulation lipoprotein [Metabacillus fastidiosus]MEC2074742.1 YhcN/YlaJ family sporulation lipoprotein [Metabacillus fastidiosus]
MLRYILAIIISVMILNGCASNNGAIGTDNENSNGPVQVKNSVKNEVDPKTGQEVSKHLVDLATKIPNVNNATAVVIGPYAVVGIDVNAKLDRSKVGSIKYSVAESLKHDPHGANAIVIADPDTTARLGEMGKEIQEGRPIAGILDELAAIVGRIMPEVPSDMLDNQNVKPTEQNDDQLNKQQEKQLNEQQEKQSNDYLNKTD